MSDPKEPTNAELSLKLNTITAEIQDLKAELSQEADSLHRDVRDLLSLVEGLYKHYGLKPPSRDAAEEELGPQPGGSGKPEAEDARKPTKPDLGSFRTHSDDEDDTKPPPETPGRFGGGPRRTTPLRSER